MKKIIVSALLLIASATSYSQPITNTAQTIKTDYLQKSENQKTAAWLTLVGGATFILVGELIRDNNKSTSPELWLDINFFMHIGSEVVFTGIGILSIAGSVPLFIASSINKRKGMSLSFKNETAPQIQRSSLTYKSIPSLSLKINL